MNGKVTILGLGPGAAEELTVRAWRVLTTAPRILLRTERHPAVNEVRAACRPDAVIQSCDDLYEAHAGFADVYAAVVQRVLDQAQLPGGVVYAVPGHPWVGEATTPQILARAAELDLSVALVPGLSFVPEAFGAAGVDLMDGSQVADAMLLARQHHPQVDVNLPLLVGQLYARWLASDVKLTLLNAYPEEHPVTLIAGAGAATPRLQTVPLAELDHDHPCDHMTSLYVPPLPAHSSFTALQELVAHLRAPEGCPWDREQTLASLRSDLLDETAEALEAIDLEANGTDNSRHIAEELGDVLLVITMLTQIATEEGRFRMGDVVRDVVTKLIRRHPHVFGDVAVSGVGHVLANWDAIKVQEKAAQGVQAGPLDGVAAALPALEKARKLQSKAAKAGLLDRRALGAANPALAEALGPHPDAARLGEVLWQLVALAHTHELNPEDALRSYAVQVRERLGAA